MTAPNHALTGAFIGLSITNPWLALPLAFASHFVCDAIPHWDPPGGRTERIKTKLFVYTQLVGGAVLCMLLVLLLVLTHPVHWLLAAVCAFLAASPDLFWILRFIRVRKTGVDKPLTNPFLKFHANLQWRTGPGLWWVEVLWFVLAASLVAVRL